MDSKHVTNPRERDRLWDAEDLLLQLQRSWYGTPYTYWQDAAVALQKALDYDAHEREARGTKD